MPELRGRFINKKSEILPLLVIGAVALFIFVQALFMPPLARLLPLFITTVAILIVLVQVSILMFKTDGTADSDSTAPEMKEDQGVPRQSLRKKFIGTAISICGFVLIAFFADFLIAIFVFLPTFMVIMGARDWKRIVIVSVLFYCFIYFAFVKLIRVPL